MICLLRVGFGLRTRHRALKPPCRKCGSSDVNGFTNLPAALGCSRPEACNHALSAARSGLFRAQSATAQGQSARLRDWASFAAWSFRPIALRKAPGGKPVCVLKKALKWDVLRKPR